MDPFDIFILFTKDNEEIASSISHYLTKIGFTVFRNQMSAISEKEFSERIITSEIIAILIGKDINRTASSDFVSVYSIKKPVVPILLPDSSPQDIPPSLKSRQFLDLRKGMESCSELDNFITIYKKNRERIKQVLKDIDNLKNSEYFVKSWGNDEFEIKKKWASIESDTNIKMTSVYGEIIENPAICCGNLEFLLNLAELFTDTNHVNESVRLLIYLETTFRLKEDYGKLQHTLCELAWCFYLQGQYDKASSILKEQQKICEKVTDLKVRNDGLQKSFGYQALIYEIQGKKDQALLKFHEQQEICRKSGNEYWLQISLGNEGLLLKDLGKYDEAWKLFEEKEKISRKISNFQGLQWALKYKADIYIQRGDFTSALTLLKEQESICRQIGYYRGLALSLKQQDYITTLKSRAATRENKG